MRLSPAAATYRSLATLYALQDLSKASYRGRGREAGEAFLETSIQLVVHFRRCIRSHIKKTIDAVSMGYFRARFVVHACLASFEETR